MTALAASQTQRFRNWISLRLGLRFEDSQVDFLTGVMSQRASRRALSGVDYLDELERAAPDAELQTLIGELTVPETYFFRHVEQYRAYGEVALPAAQQARAFDQRLQVLSVGCASGEEPYSLVMWARDHGGWQVEVTALDINPAVLAKAMRGLYTTWALRETPIDTQQRWFRETSAGFELDPAIRRAVTFQRMNLAQEHAEFWTPNRFDVIFCRNVLMYFQPEVAQAAIARMTQTLTPHGHLFLGHAETMRGLSNEYHLCHTHNTFYYQRKHPSVAPAVGVFQAPLAAFSMATPGPSWTEAIRHSADRIQALSESFEPATEARASQPRLSAPVTAQLQVARDFLKRERFADALALLNGLPGDVAPHPEVMLLRAALLLHSGQLADAETVSNQLLERDELNAGAHYLLALCRESAADLQGAREHDEAAIYLDAEFAMPRLHLGLMARRGGDWAGARSALGDAMPLLKREDAARVLLFGGGFGRDGLIALCRAELQAAEVRA